MRNSFSFLLSGKLFICPLILNESFAGQNNIGCRSLLFITLNISWQSLLACKVSFGTPADSLMGTPLQVTNCVSLAAFKILFLSLIFDISIMMCLGVGLFGSILLGTLPASWTRMSTSFAIKFSVIIVSSRLPISCSLSSPSSSPMMWMLEHSKLSQRLLPLPSFFWTLFPSPCSDWVFFASIYSLNLWLDSRLHPLHC